MSKWRRLDGGPGNGMSRIEADAILSFGVATKPLQLRFRRFMSTASSLTRDRNTGGAHMTRSRCLFDRASSSARYDPGLQIFSI